MTFGTRQRSYPWGMRLYRALIVGALVVSLALAGGYFVGVWAHGSDCARWERQAQHWPAENQPNKAAWLAGSGC